MAQPSSSQIVANIHRAVAEADSREVPPDMTEADESTNEEGYPAPGNPRALFETLERGPFPEMRRREAVDQLGGTGLVGVFKRLLGRVLRVVSGPQAAFNRKAIEAAEITAGEVDQLRLRVYWDVRGVYEKLAAVEAAIEAEQGRAAAEITRLTDRLAETEAELVSCRDEIRSLKDGEIPRLFDAVQQRGTWEEHGKIWEVLKSVSQGLEQRASQSDVEKLWGELGRAFTAIGERASQEDVSKLWEEIPRLVAAIDARASQEDMSKLWAEIPALVRAVEERAAQADIARLWEEIPKVFAAIEARASQGDVAGLWEQVVSINKSIEDQVAGVWSGIAERDLQQQKDFEAIQGLHDGVGFVEAELREIRARALTLRERVDYVDERLAAAPVGASAAPQIPALASASPATETDISTNAIQMEIRRRLDLAYLQFQRLYRGDEGELKKRLSRYVPVLAHAHPAGTPKVLDVACGDGIFLERLAEEKWPVSGVDMNGPMVKLAVGRGLKVEKADALEFLELAEPGTYDAITALQFVEHLPPDAIFRFLMGAYRSLKPGGTLLIETINPHTLKALHWFHLDLSHARLVYPEMLGLLAETAGFTGIAWKGINPVEEKERLQYVAGSDQAENMARLNILLFGDQDYYLTARKASR